MALAISEDVGCHFGSPEDGWEMAGRAPVVLAHPIQHKYNQFIKKKPYITHKIKTRWVGV